LRVRILQQAQSPSSEIYFRIFTLPSVSKKVNFIDADAIRRVLNWRGLNQRSYLISEKAHIRKVLITNFAFPSSSHLHGTFLTGFKAPARYWTVFRTRSSADEAYIIFNMFIIGFAGFQR
jgi:hypothetical protein